MMKNNRLLNVSISISLLIISLSILVFSIKNNTAKAQSPDTGTYRPIGLLNAGIGKYVIVGYNDKTGGTKVIAMGSY